jgi:hypothetical protein
MSTAAMLTIGIVILIAVALIFMALWVADARRADRVASDPERTGQGRRWPWARNRSGRTPGSHR